MDVANQGSSTETLSQSKATQLMINYTVKYGSQEFTWTEHNCESLHKAKKLKIDYRLGQLD